jgi:hypothetical protein
LILYGGEPNADDADWHGFLVLEGNCLYVDWENPHDADDAPDARMLVAFPSRNTSWDETRQAVKYGGTTLRVGEWVDIGGSGLFGPAEEFDWAVPPDPSCDTTEVWLVG